jgi:hypothetical protein
MGIEQSDKEQRQTNKKGPNWQVDWEGKSIEIKSKFKNQVSRQFKKGGI